MKVFRPIGKLAEKYNDPKYVVKFQEKFGVKLIEENENDETSQDASETKNEKRGLRPRVRVGEKSAKEARASHKIENRFWYYLFTFGAFLGDDAFYISFYPFWIWNIDGAVGRRLCVTWSIAMYFGE